MGGFNQNESYHAGYTSASENRRSGLNNALRSPTNKRSWYIQTGPHEIENTSDVAGIGAGLYLLIEQMAAKRNDQTPAAKNRKHSAKFYYS